MLSLLFTAAFAQDFVDAEAPEINAQHFRPTIDGVHTLWTDDSARGPHKQFMFRPLFHYTHEPLVYEYDDGERVGLVNNLLQADLMAAFAFDRFRIGLDVPIYLFAEADDLPSTAGLGDIAVDGKITALDEEEFPVGLAVQARLGMPTGLRKLPLGSRNTTWEVSVIVDKSFDEKWFLMANLGYRGGPSTSLENIRINDFFAFRAAGAYAITENAGAALEFAGDVPFTGENTLEGMPIEALVSGYGKIAQNLQLRGGAGAAVTPGISAPDFRLILGFEWRPEKDLDKDDDGILDADDACPEVPEDIDSEQDEDGCPEDIGSVIVTIVDEETGEGIEGAMVAISGTDLAGASGLAAELPSGDYEAGASADGYETGKLAFSIADEDADKAVVVKLKKIEIPMGTLKVVVKDPEGKPLDSVVIKVNGKRHKGTPFETDLEPQEVTVTASANGYRVAPGKTAMVKKDEVTELEFVLEPAQAKVEGEKIDLRDSVYFDTNKATIQERSYGLLDDVAGILVDHPELKKIRIEGHTDSRGSAEYNKSLSDRRAASVKAYLVGKGVEESRLESVGYGEERPLDKRNVKEAWDKNRRVDFFVTERAD